MKKWKPISKLKLFSSRLLTIFSVESESPLSGKRGKFDVVEASNWVNIIVETDQSEFVLVKQYRHGTGQVTLEIPGGAIDSGEDPLIAAKRETREETGHESDEWIFLGKQSANPAFMTNYVYSYLCRNAKAKASTDFDDLEEIEIETVSKGRVFELLENGEIDHSLVVAAFGLYQLKAMNA